MSTQLCVREQGVVSLTFRELQDNLAKMYNTRNHIYAKKFKLKHCTYKVSTWNTHKKYDFCDTQISGEYLEELSKRLWNNP